MALLAFQNHRWQFSSISTHPSLTSGLVSYWNLDEASGTRTDSHGSNDLADNNTVGSTTGVGGTGTAALFVAANSEFLSISDASQSGLDITGDLTFSCKFKATTWVEAGFASKWNSGQYSYLISTLSTTATGATMSANGTSATGRNVTTSTASTGVWYTMTWRYDASAGQIEVFRDGVSEGTRTGLPTSLFNGSAQFQLSGVADSGGADFLDGAMQVAGIWNRLLTDQEVTDHHFGGSALLY